jgi:hypothetical protein
MTEPPSLAVVQFLAWVASHPRSYGDVKEAWRSTCPRLSTWEDALDAGLVRFETNGSRVGDAAPVRLTAKGAAALGQNGRSPA